MILSKKQIWSILKAIKRINLWEGSVRASKTWASLVAWIKFIAVAPEGDLLMTGKTDRSLYRNVLKPMQDFLGDDFQYKMGRGECTLWDRVIHIVGANDERAEGKIRGMTCAGAYGDEVSLWAISFFKMMLSRMSVYGAKFFGTTNADAPKHPLKTEYIDRVNELDMALFHFTLDDNIFLPPEFIANLKKEYVGLWFKRFILGLWVMAEGAIYDFFDEKLHVIKKVPRADRYIVSIDYGTGNPTAWGLYGMRNKGMPRCWLEREYYYDSKKEGGQKTDSEYSDNLRDFLGDLTPNKIILDPSAASFKAQLRKDGFLFINDADNTVLDGIRTQAKLLKSGFYAICQGNPHTVEEYGGYCWDEKAQMRGEDKPIKRYDHTKDHERYLLQTVYGGQTIDYEKLTQE